MYALVRNNTIEATLGRLPDAAVTLTDGRWVKVREGTVAEQQECGYFQVTEVPRPADTDTTTHDRSVELVNGTPTVVWTERPKTAEELAAAQQDANRSTIETNLLEDLTLIQAVLSDTNANINSNPAARIKELGRSLRRLIKHELSQFDTAE